MSTDKEYEACFNQWVKGQKNLIEQIEMNIENAQNMISVHTENLKIQKKSLKLEKQLLSKAISINEADKNKDQKK